MPDDRLFNIEDMVEVPILRQHQRKGAARGTNLDARFLNDYPREWNRCRPCGGQGRVTIQFARPFIESGMWSDQPEVAAGIIRCGACLGMGSIKARVRLEAGHRCERCRHPYMPKGDALMLGVEPSGIYDCEACGGRGFHIDYMRVDGGDEQRVDEPCEDCHGAGKVWEGWSACDAECQHGGPLRWRKQDKEWEDVSAVEYLVGWPERPFEAAIAKGLEVEAAWRILTVHHLDGDKANLRWWNLAALCQRCHLEIQAKVVMERVYPWEHSDWFKPHAAGYYAFIYNGEELTREQTTERLDELLELELA